MVISDITLVNGDCEQTKQPLPLGFHQGIELINKLLVSNEGRQIMTNPEQPEALGQVELTHKLCVR